RIAKQARETPDPSIGGLFPAKRDHRIQSRKPELCVSVTEERGESRNQTAGNLPRSDILRSLIEFPGPRIKVADVVLLPSIAIVLVLVLGEGCKREVILILVEAKHMNRGG